MDIMENKAYVYKIIDLYENKIVYVGQHNGNNKYYEGSSLILSKYKKKYGTKAFRNKYKFEVIEYCNFDKLNDKEIFYIKLYDTFKKGLNLTEGGFTLYKLVQGKSFPQKNLKLKGQKRSKETVYLMSESKKDYKPSKLCHENRVKKLSKSVLQYNLNGIFKKEWESGKQAANALGIKSYGEISACCLGKTKSSAGYIWKYKDNNPIKLKILPKSKTSYPKNRKPRIK
jgi:hypothetical protein